MHAVTCQGEGKLPSMDREGQNHYHTRGAGGRTSVVEADPPPSLNWGNRKRLRCIKFQRKDEGSPTGNNPSAADDATATEGAAGRRAARAEKDSRRVLRSSEANWAAAAAAAATRSNGRMRSPEAEEKKSSSSASEGTTVWPKFAIGLTTKEKEEDFLVLKGSKLPQRPKKRAKLIQKTLNLVSPGAWLCDLTLERYEVREKKISKKKPRGLKAMGDLEIDSE